jgi:hypothetical protein
VTGADRRLHVVVRPQPTEHELAAIAVALETVVLPALTRAAAPAAGVRTVESESRWRFAGRWWSKPVPLNRDRP